MPNLEEYISITGQSVIDDLRLLAERLKGKVIQHINSTSVGGGVAEILSRAVPLVGASTLIPEGNYSAHERSESRGKDGD